MWREMSKIGMARRRKHLYNEEVMMVIAKETTRLHYLEQLNSALIYIQEHIGEKLTLDTIADEACISPFHFHRIFSAFMKESLGVYIQRLRIERAALKLSTTGDDITSIALDVGYDTSSSMARAFRKRFGCSPFQFRSEKRCFQASSPVPITVEREEKKAMKPEIRTIPDRDVVYVRKMGAYAKAATEAWSSVCKFAYSNRLVGKNSMMIGISYDEPNITEEQKLRYEACITVDKPVTPKGEVGFQTIRGGTYAVFLHRGPYEKFSETYRIIFTQWLPASGERLRDEPCFEVYLNRDPARTKPENLKTEIYVPLAR
jgi:AraC family transcriptional regulator